ncbi:sensor histidine kinase [Mahella australiensis]|uniref:histidine kinase n=1 Tax=Mahella australiensis (strain DSM 15567 / CIP 107919 / 50-1 BON) TaxID=697281 RepID=F3ZYP6_MAHA5|nr:sensor histidine kinase [Mahella australiensis]AEE97814.1 integral membrane sensor signal transduction histidine kinase [Mahella australiensis 50-1 BON]
MSNKTEIWRYIKNYKFNSIFVKNFILVLLLIILPLVGLSIGVYGYYNNLMQGEMRELNANALSKVRDMVDVMIRETDKQSLNIASDQDVQWFLMFPMDYASADDIYNKTQAVNRNINMVVNSSDYIDSIYIYSERNDFVLSTRGNGTLSDFYDKSWHTSYTTNKNDMFYWNELRQGADATGVIHKYISIYRTINPFDRKSEGTVVININVERLGGLFGNVTPERFENVFMVDAGGKVLYNKDPAVMGKDIKAVTPIEYPGSDGTISRPIVDINGIKEVISIVPSEYNDWTMISIVPLSQYEYKIRYLRAFMTIIIMICIIIGVVLSFFAAIRIFRPIKDIIVLMEKPSEWMQSSKGTNNSDEFKYIADNIMKTLDENQEMGKELERRLELLKSAQALALQSQISPHFLYNTLETINWMAVRLTGGPNEVSSTVVALSQLLRLSFETEGNLIPITVEIKHAQRYVDIQRTRYNDKFDVLWSIADEIMDCKILKITLQPLIENAIYHGIKPKTGKGMISIKAYKMGADIIIEVADNGIGIPRDEVVRLNTELSGDYYAKEGQHIGLRNVNQRIKLMFGQKYGITIESEQNVGTTVCVLIPIVK